MTSATVTVTAADSFYTGEVSADFTISAATKNFSVGKTSYNKVYGNAAFNLNISSTDHAAISYSSDKPAVATVNANGKVTIKGAGTATITVFLAATTNYKAATATVTGNEKLTYKSNNTKIATVSTSGKVTLKGTYGKVVITINSAASTNYNKAATTGTTLKSLSKGKKYYVRVCAYTTISGKKVCGDYSSIKNATVKEKQ